MSTLEATSTAPLPNCTIHFPSSLSCMSRPNQPNGGEKPEKAKNAEKPK